jgi:hypothetical protein
LNFIGQNLGILNEKRFKLRFVERFLTNPSFGHIYRLDFFNREIITLVKYWIIYLFFFITSFFYRLSDYIFVKPSYEWLIKRGTSFSTVALHVVFYNHRMMFRRSVLQNYGYWTSIESYFFGFCPHFFSLTSFSFLIL